MYQLKAEIRTPLFAHTQTKDVWILSDNLFTKQYQHINKGN